MVSKVDAHFRGSGGLKIRDELRHWKRKREKKRGEAGQGIARHLAAEGGKARKSMFH